MEGQNRKKERTKKGRGNSLDASSSAALAWPFISATCEDKGKPYRQSYVDWRDQGQLKEVWIGVVPPGSGVSRRSKNREAVMMFDTSLSTHKSVS